MNAQRVLIVGGVAGGASCAARLRRMDESAEIIVFEKGPYVSYANCGLPYHAGDVIKDEAKLLVATPELFWNRFRVRMHPLHEVLRIDRAAKAIEVRDLQRGETRTERYDKLVLAPGASPIKPPIPGIDSPGIITVRDIPDARAIRERLAGKPHARAVIVGAGYIGLEMAENFVHRGAKTTVIERLPQVMAPADPEMAAPLADALRSRGVEVLLGAEAVGFEPQPDGSLLVQLKDAPAIPADVVILSIGVRPNAGLAKDAGLEMGRLGGIRVDERQRTSDPDIFAVGDAVEVRDFVTGIWTMIPLAGPANRQGRIAADVIAGRDAAFRGTQGTAVLGLFDMTFAMTGHSEKSLRRLGVPCEKVHLFPGNHAGYYPGAETIQMKVLFRPRDGRLLGAQAVGKAGVEKRIDVIATAIQFGGSVFDLEEAELCYAPQFGSAKDPVNMAGFIAANHLRGDSPIAQWDELLRLPENERPFVLDVREPAEFAAGSVPGAVNIPLGKLRDRLAEIPRDREVWAHCGVGQRAHYAVRVLRQLGFTARNLTGGWKQLTVNRRAGR